MITPRDEIALDFIEKFGVATTNQIDKIAYNNTRVCQKRLTSLVKLGVLLRCKNLYTKEYLYSTKKINLKQLKHKLLRNEFYLKLLQIANVKMASVEESIGAIKPDAIFICSSLKTGKGYFLALEVESSNNTINVSKYEQYRAENPSKPMPLVIYITNKRIPETNFKYVKLDLEMNNFESILT